MESVILTRDEFEKVVKENSGKGYGSIFKFTANWCGPCKTIKSLVTTLVAGIPATSKLACYEVNVDDSFELYATLKRNRMVNGIPALLFYAAGNVTGRSDDSVTGANDDALRGFFERCIAKSS
jgi:thioredoxin-like negative regulator of GroEL